MEPNYAPAVRQLLDHAHQHLLAHRHQDIPPLYDLLSRLAIDLLDRDLLDTRPPSLGGTVDRAATSLINLAPPQRVARPFDNDLRARLAELDSLPADERIKLLDTALAHAAPTPAPVRTPERRRPAGPCPCPCNNGQFCGGCGHAGCGGRR